jgi:hypothetical protein
MEENAFLISSQNSLLRRRHSFQYRNYYFFSSFSKLESFVGNGRRRTWENHFDAVVVVVVVDDDVVDVGKSVRFRRGNFAASSLTPDPAKLGFVFPTATETNEGPSLGGSAAPPPRRPRLYPLVRGMDARRNSYRRPPRRSTFEAVFEVLCSSNLNRKFATKNGFLLATF